MRQFVWLIVIATGYIGMRAVLDYARGINLVENGRVQGSVGGMFKNPNDLALNMVAVLPFAVFLVLQPVSMLKRALAAFCAAMMLGAIVASQSRSGTVGLAAMTLVLGAQLLKTQAWPRHRRGLCRPPGPAGTAVVLLAARGEHHQREPGRDRFAGSAVGAAARVVRRVRHAPVHRCRRRAVQELQPRGARRSVAREPQRGAAGGRRARRRRAGRLPLSW